MTSFYLLLLILSGIVLQLLIFVGLGFWRNWRNYQTLPTSELTLSVPADQSNLSSEADHIANAWSGFRTFKVSRKVFEDTTQSICSFYLAPEDGQPLPSFKPGQFLTFQLDIPSKDGNTEQIVRCYSLSDAPYPDCYRVSIKRVLQAVGDNALPGRSSNYFHDHITVGDRLEVRAPSGNFHIDKSDSPVVLIGGGIGITPMLSILNWCLANQPSREIWLFYGVRNSQELVMQSHLETLANTHSNFRLWICFSNPLPDDIAKQNYPHHGRVDINLLRTMLPLKPYHFYICGPTPMMESLVPALDHWGVPDENIHFEAFGPASIKLNRSSTTIAAVQTAEADTDIVVNFASSNKQLQWKASANSLLEFAEDSGIMVSSGCRAGICGTCQTTIRSGEVTYHQTPEFQPESGTCLLCICSPKTNLTLDL